MIIDFHTHVFPDKVAAKALPKLAAGSGGMEPVYDATVDGLESFLSKNGIDKAVALNISTNTHRKRPSRQPRCFRRIGKVKSGRYKRN